MDEEEGRPPGAGNSESVGMEHAGDWGSDWGGEDYRPAQASKGWGELGGGLLAPGPSLAASSKAKGRGVQDGRERFAKK